MMMVAVRKITGMLQTCFVSGRCCERFELTTLLILITLPMVMHVSITSRNITTEKEKNIVVTVTEMIMEVAALIHLTLFKEAEKKRNGKAA